MNLLPESGCWWMWQERQLPWHEGQVMNMAWVWQEQHLCSACQQNMGLLSNCITTAMSAAFG